MFNDSDVFEAPELFNPERFLSGDVQTKKSYTSVLFGLGKSTVCIGFVLISSNDSH